MFFFVFLPNEKCLDRHNMGHNHSGVLEYGLSKEMWDEAGKLAENSDGLGNVNAAT